MSCTSSLYYLISCTLKGLSRPLYALSRLFMS
nr:MAG TPA: hypothetical protein [Caudoviricetes sp.]